MTRQSEHIDHDRYREWLTLDGGPAPALEPSQERRLHEHLAECGQCRVEREELARMDALLDGERIGVRAGFRQEVMRRLPAAGWESRYPRSWRLPVAVMLLLGAAAALLLGMHSAQSAPSLPLIGALGAIADAVSTGLLAGTGMLWASWRGVGFALDALLSPSATAVLVVSVLCLDILVLALIARRDRSRRAPAVERGGSGRSGGSNGGL